ncbi:MAG: DoxX family protein [Sedimentisphaerales bacterium]|nr:DoxX family protein [Sedimentisphaerales bacterium]
MTRPQTIRNVDLVPLFVRITLAVIFIYHGYGKVFQGGHEGIAQLMAAKAAPLPGLLGWLAGLTELAGGLLIGIGLLSRLWALGLGAVMAVAILTVHGSNGFDIRNQGYEYCLTLLLLALAILLGGPGGFSLDTLIKSRRRTSHPRKSNPLE